MKNQIKRALYPIRKLAARFVNISPTSSENQIIFKAANLIASEQIDGDYLEFGVYAGKSLINAYHVIKQVFTYHQKPHTGRMSDGIDIVRSIWKGMRFFAFDSFQGLPDLSDNDLNTRYFKKSEYLSTEQNFINNLVKADVPLNKVQTVVGWFSDTCTETTIRKFGMKKASIIHIDCDLFSSTKVALNFVQPLLQDGTILIFDDWYCYRGNPRLGEAGAFNEWRKELPNWTFVEFQKEGSTRNSFIASKNE